MTEADHLAQEVAGGLAIRYPAGVPELTQARVDYERTVITQMGYDAYFLVVADIVKHAKSQGIRVGPGRGCLTGDVPVRTRRGLMPLATVRPGDEVLTHCDVWRPVVEVFRYDNEENLIHLRSYYDDAQGVTLTTDHHVLVEKARRITNRHLVAQGYRWEESTGDAHWIPSREVEVGDLVVTPVARAPVVDRDWIDLADYAGSDVYVNECTITETTPVNRPFPYSRRDVHRRTGLSRNAIQAVLHDEGVVRRSTRDKALAATPFASVREWRKYLEERQSVRQVIPRYVHVDEGFCFLMGMLASNGWIKQGSPAEVGIAVRRSKNDLRPATLFDQVFSLPVSVGHHRTTDLTQYRVHSRTVRALIAAMWHGYTFRAQTKSVPAWLLRLPEKKRYALLEGLWWGDGCHSGKSTYSTTSAVLRDQVRDLLWGLGLPAGLRGEVRFDTRIGWEADGRESWVITTTPSFGPMRNQHGALHGPHIFTRVRAVEQRPAEPVYDLSVNEDHSYATSSFVVHNSAAGSCVSYALGITQLDPLEHGLIFERFLNPERPSMPDIDLDFDERRRGEMIRYVTKKYGEDHVAQIVTFSTIKTRAAIKDAAKVLHDKAGYALADRIIRALPPVVMAADIPLTGIFDPKHERYAEAAEVRALVESDSQIAEIMEVARGLEGLKRQWGVHASGIVICAEPLINHVPIMCRDSDGAIVTQLDMNACEALGLVKMDFLGLRNLTVIDDCLRDIAATGQQPPDLNNLPMNDQATFDLLTCGDTLGVFQLDGVPMRDLLRRMKPQCLADIAAAAALYRPGPMGSGSHIAYVERKAGRQEVTPIHPELAEPLADILGETYGLVVFQEQVLAIVQRVSGYSLGRADMLRRAMGKKKRDVLAREYKPFAAGMTESGYSSEAIETLWNVFLPCADYLFVKSHATGYAVIAYQGAYLKAHYPTQYMAALLTSVGSGKKDDKESGKQGRMGIYLAECRRMGIRVTVPDINESQGPFTATNGEIRFGLAAVRDVGAAVVEAICQGRMYERYLSFHDCLRKADVTKLNRKALEALIRAGAFDSLGYPRRGLEDICGDALAAAVKLQRAEAQGLYSLFAGDEPDAMDVAIPEREWPAKKLLELEREMLGLYVSAHPLDGAEHILAAGTSITSILDGTVAVDTEVTIAGILASVTRKMSKAGKPWALAQLEDHAVGVELCCFARTYEEFGPLLKRDAVVLVTGRVSSRDRDGDRLSVIVDRVSVPDLSAPITVNLPLEQCTLEAVGSFRAALEQHPGDRAVQLKLLVRPGHAPLLELDEKFRVAPGAGLVAALTGLLGDGCLSA